LIVNIIIDQQYIDFKEEILSIQQVYEAGAVVSFIGQVRAAGEQGELIAMELEHYPGMTESALQLIVTEAGTRWSLLAVTVVHRVGRLLPGDPIVLVAVASQHRAAAFEAAAFIMDYLKTRAPFWKKEITAQGAHWVEARERDEREASRW
jgi:molybdopterin synthase catalytic subunit